MGFRNRLLNRGSDEPENDQIQQVMAEPAFSMMGTKMLEPCDRIQAQVGASGSTQTERSTGATRRA